MIRRLIAEALGAFAIVFIGTGAIIVNDITHGVVTHVGVCLAWGLVVMAMIDALGELSGAHFNPAVTVAFAVAGRFPVRTVPAYVAAQVAGAVLASLVLKSLFPGHATLGATLPGGPGDASEQAWRAFVIEVLVMALLMLVVLAVATGPKEKGITASLAIGGVIAFEALFAGPISGASMNPARSLAPALVSGHTAGLSIYLTAPFLGAILAVGLWRFLRPRETEKRC